MFNIVSPICKLLKLTASVQVFFFSLFYLMVLLFVGTIAQKDMGLYAAQTKFFSSFFMDFYGVPLPSGYSILGLMFVGLAVKTFTEKMKKGELGSFITHLSVLLLFFGGFLTAFTTNEGFMVVEEGASSNYFSDYHQTELAIIQPLDKNTQRVYAFTQDLLNAGGSLTYSEKPSFGSIKVVKFYPNAQIQRYNKEQNFENAHPSFNSYKVTGLPKHKESEMNQSALLLNIEGVQYLLFEDMPFKPKANIGGEKYTLELRQKRTYLPFKIHLNKFEKNNYKGTSEAKSYKSFIELEDENAQRWSHLIEMNEPLRYEDYTLYQSSFIEGTQNATVLAVVQNKGRLFPYIASIVLCIGLLVHLFIRLPKLIRKSSACVLLALLFTGFNINVQALDGSKTLENIANIPVLENGRIKPIDSFARHQLLQFYGKDSLPNMSASAWLVHLILNPEQAYSQKIFTVKNPAVLHMLGFYNLDIPARLSFETLAKAMAKLTPQIESFKQNRNQLSIEESQLLTLHDNIVAYYDLSRSFSFVLPLFVLNESQALVVGLESKKAYNYLDMKPVIYKLEELAQKSPTVENKQLVEKFYKISQDYQSTLLKIVPAQWGETSDWYSPWQTMEQGQGSPKTAAFFNVWGTLSLLYLTGEERLMLPVTDNILTQSMNLSPQSKPSMSVNLNTSLEYAYNQFQPFHWGLVVAVLCFILWMLWQVLPKKLIYMLMAGLLVTMFTLLTSGISMRMLIMQRPPVATLYESILFVSWVVVIFSFIFEYKRRDGIGFFLASALGSVLLFVASRYALDGDTMGNLKAVLNTNFWLATHVVVITIGYGCSLVAGLLAHVYLVQRLRAVPVTVLSKLHKNVLAACLIALFFTTLGTILGGIWADQSWGRFWGWDPKENGAMFICLWLIWVLHGRIAGYLRALYFASLTAAINIVVALAWFGVNLLGVGLHSYGFTQNILWALMLFCVAQLIVILLLTFMNYKKEKTVKLS